MTAINKNTMQGKLLSAMQTADQWLDYKDLAVKAGIPAKAASCRLVDLRKAGLVVSDAALGHLEYRLTELGREVELFEGKPPAKRKPYTKRASAAPSPTPTIADPLPTQPVHLVAPPEEPSFVREVREAIAARQYPATLGVSTFQQAIKDFADQLSEYVVQEVEREVIHKLAKLIPTIEEGIERKLHTDEVSTNIPTKPKLPSVLIVGLLPIQAGSISVEFRDVFDLSFWNNGDGIKTLKDRVKGVEHILLHTGHVSHSTIETIKSVGGKPTWVNGGVSQMRNALMEVM